MSPARGTRASLVGPAGALRASPPRACTSPRPLRNTPQASTSSSPLQSRRGQRRCRWRWRPQWRRQQWRLRMRLRRRRTQPRARHRRLSAPARSSPALLSRLPGPVLAVRSQDFEVSAFGSALRRLYQAQAAHVQRARVTAATAAQGVGTDAGLIRFASLVCVSSPWLAPPDRVASGQRGGQCVGCVQQPIVHVPVHVGEVK